MTEQTERRKLPGEWAAEDPRGHYDCTGEIGPLVVHTREVLWPMYSFDRPAHDLWNAIAGALHKRGWSDGKIKAWLQSKHPRWALDGFLGDSIEALGKCFAEKIKDSDVPNEWIKE